MFFSLIASGNQTAAKSWKDIRDFEITKQNLDFSCGIASLATIFNNHFKEKVTESDLIDEFSKIKNIPKEKIEKTEKYSLLDLKKITESRGYRAEGLALNFESLKKIKPPFIAYIVPQGNDHFTVVKSIDEKFVHLADPSWGSMKIIHNRFIEIWKTRNDPKYYGRILRIY